MVNFERGPPWDLDPIVAATLMRHVSDDELSLGVHAGLRVDSAQVVAHSAPTQMHLRGHGGYAFTSQQSLDHLLLMSGELEAGDAESFWRDSRRHIRRRVRRMSGQQHTNAMRSVLAERTGQYLNVTPTGVRAEADDLAARFIVFPSADGGGQERYVLRMNPLEQPLAHQLPGAHAQRPVDNRTDVVDAPLVIECGE